MTSLRQILAFNMKERRRTLGISQAKLAEKVNTSAQYLAMIELTKKFPSDGMLERIAEALEMPASELFSMKSVPSDSIKKLHESVLTDIGRVVGELINVKLKELKGED
jgi:transcriptional regulator with XRE-family HTH domain